MNQIALVSAIVKEIESQGISLDSKSMNKVIDCENQIISECNRERVYASEGMGFISWFGSDDTGMSSKWLASILNGEILKDVYYPYDPSDFGRCFRMLNCVTDARALFALNRDKISSLSKVWAKYLENWDALEGLYVEESPNRSCQKLYDLMKKLQKEAT